MTAPDRKPVTMEGLLVFSLAQTDAGEARLCPEMSLVIYSNRGRSS